MWTFSQISTFFSKHPRAKIGFTLIELLVVLAIMTILTLSLLVRQTKFDSATLLRSLAYSVALSVRQAQIYGVSVFGNISGGSNAVFANAYGVYFSNGGTTSYFIFADLNGDTLYTPGEEVKTFQLNNRFVISDFCAIGTNSGGGPVTRCKSDGSASYLAILFRRPNPEAVILTNTTTDSYTKATVTVKSGGGDTRNICVYQTGQISVANPGSTCP